MIARIRAAIVAAIIAAPGCAIDRGDAYLASFAEAERAFHAGRWSEAARAWSDAAGKAKRVKDRDEARFLEARAEERAGRFAEARAAYEKLAAESPDGPRTARAVFDVANLEIERGDAARGYAMLEEATKRFPKHGLARVSVHRLVRHAEDAGGPETALRWLDAREPLFRGTEQDEVIQYERALVLERCGKKQEAHDAFIATARRHPYPFGGLTDDAFWRAAALDEEAGRYDEAIAHLHELLAAREPASTGASYERPRFSEAQLRIAMIYRDKIKDRKAARREFERLYARHTTTTKRDDAVWSGALLAREDGDTEAVCKLAKRLVTEFPESRYARCAHLLCPAVPADQRACADYIQRDVRGEKKDEQRAEP